jgi:hypothetical protein
MEELDVDDRLILKFIAIFMYELRHAIDWTGLGNEPMGNFFWYVSGSFSFYQSVVYSLTGHLSAGSKGSLIMNFFVFAKDLWDKKRI